MLLLDLEHVKQSTRLCILIQIDIRRDVVMRRARCLQVAKYVHSESELQPVDRTRGLDDFISELHRALR